MLNPVKYLTSTKVTFDKKFSLFLILIIISILTTVSCTQTSNIAHQPPNNITTLPQYIFTPANNINNQVEQTLTTAKTQNKKALLVLGAQWCHDSKGLAKTFSTPQMQEVLLDKYQVLFIDVGFLEKGFNVVEQFGLPIYYGTPTVMVIDPVTSTVINRTSMQKWLSADAVPLTEYVDYFTSINVNMSVNKKAIESTNKAMKNYLAVINRFETEQAKRLKDAYAIIGPLLKQYLASDNKEASSDFSDKWEQVRKLRYRIQNDIQALTKQAQTNVESGQLVELTLPTYPAFSWE